MTEPKKYTTAGAFRRALEERLKKTSQTEQTDINRLRRQVSFDRLLARLFHDSSVPWVLKGGYALELRFKMARSTVDIDLTMGRANDGTDGSDINQIVREMLQAAASLPLGDWFEFTIGSPMMDITAAPYGGARYPVEVRMDGRIFAKFHLDAGIGDIVIHPVEIIETRDWLAFAGIERSQVPLIAREQQFAEKIHAYTLPRNTPNSRVKDLVDMALLVGDNTLDRQRILNALRLTFERRETHPLPKTLDPPPSEWTTPFQTLAKECGLPPDLTAVFERVRKFFEEVLASQRA
jgi:Nucleotidyl transferase AbiEii toxin, Type IV TA system